MKCTLLALFVAISAIALNHPAYASQEEVSATITDGAQAAALVTEPITINSQVGNAINRTNNFKQIADSIGSARQKECQKINPLDLINNPGAIFKPCQNQTNNQTPQATAEPIEYFQVPRLDSGINVTVTKF